jgi:hypothetical protein
MAEDSAITADMRAAIGVESAAWTIEVDKSSIRMFARAVGHTDPVFYDEAVAKQRGYRSLPTPPAYLGTPVFDPVTCDPTSSSPSQARGTIKLPFKAQLNGGTEVEQFEDICAGDVLTARNKLVDINQRQGSMGTMLIHVHEITYTNQFGRTVAVFRGTGINYQPA